MTCVFTCIHPLTSFSPPLLPSTSPFFTKHTQRTYTYKQIQASVIHRSNSKTQRIFVLLGAAQMELCWKWGVECEVCWYVVVLHQPAHFFFVLRAANLSLFLGINFIWSGTEDKRLKPISLCYDRSWHVLIGTLGKDEGYETIDCYLFLSPLSSCLIFICLLLPYPAWALAGDMSLTLSMFCHCADLLSWI